MQKKILTGLIGAMLISGVAFATPSAPLQQGETQIGFDVANFNPSVSILGFKRDLGNTNTNSFSLEHGLTDKLTLGLENTKLAGVSSSYGSAEIKTTDVYAQYKLDNNFSLIAGSRNYDGTATIAPIGYPLYSGNLSESQFLWGVNAQTQLGDKLIGHAAYKKTANENEWQAGVTDQLSKNVSMDVTYKNHDYDLGAVNLKLSGVSAGLNYKF